MDYLNAFLCGGILCAIGQILIDKTKLTPARILTGYVVAGVILSAVGVYEPLVEWGGAGATVPLTGFGHSLAQGVKKAIVTRIVVIKKDLPIPCRGRSRGLRSCPCSCRPLPQRGLPWRRASPTGFG